VYVFGPAPGCPLMATLWSHEDTCCIGLTVDSASIPDASSLVECLRQGLDEVLALAG
jgi:hypothetical protein